MKTVRRSREVSALTLSITIRSYICPEGKLGAGFLKKGGNKALSSKVVHVDIQRRAREATEIGRSLSFIVSFFILKSTSSSIQFHQTLPRERRRTSKGEVRSRRCTDAEVASRSLVEQGDSHWIVGCGSWDDDDVQERQSNVQDGLFQPVCYPNHRAAK